MQATTRGYYSIIQFCPDPSRLEAVNIGVALFCPDVPFLQTRFGRRKTRVQQLFGKQDWEFVEMQRIALEARFRSQEQEFSDLAGFESFVAKRAGAFRLTPPRQVKVEDPARDLQDLFLRLVGAQDPAKHGAAKQICRELGARFRDAGIERLMQSSVTVHPPTLPKPFKAPFAYRNGRLNLIEAVQFEGHTPSSVFNRASIHAVEGQFLAEYTDPEYGELNLIVVGNFSPDQEVERKSALAVFERHNIAMHTFAGIENLIAEIKLQAHE